MEFLHFFSLDHTTSAPYLYCNKNLSDELVFFICSCRVTDLQAELVENRSFTGHNNGWVNVGKMFFTDWRTNMIQNFFRSQTSKVKHQKMRYSQKQSINTHQHYKYRSIKPLIKFLLVVLKFTIYSMRSVQTVGEQWAQLNPFTALTLPIALCSFFIKNNN